MKTKNNKAVVLFLTAAMLMTSVLPMGCSSKEAKIQAILKEKAETFIEVYASGDKDKIDDLIDGSFTYQISYAKQHDILLKMASKTEIEDIENFEVDRKAGKARIRTKISYIDIREFGRDKENKNLTKEECLEKIDAYETSILPYEDCCTIFVAKHPVTKPKLEKIVKSEHRLDDIVDEIMQRALETTEVIEI